MKKRKIAVIICCIAAVLIMGVIKIRHHARVERQRIDKIIQDSKDAINSREIVEYVVK